MVNLRLTGERGGGARQTDRLGRGKERKREKTDIQTEKGKRDKQTDREGKRERQTDRHR